MTDTVEAVDDCSSQPAPVPQIVEPKEVTPEQITPDVQMLVKRVTSVMKHLPNGMTADNETLLALSRMNRAQRRAHVAQLRQKTRGHK